MYASPAVTNAPGLGPTVYFGSYDGIFYALNARTGHVEWRYPAGGKISGLGHHHRPQRRVLRRPRTTRIYGLGISTGHKIFEMDTGAFDPVVSDGHHIYLTGYSGLFGMEPLAAAARVQASRGQPAGSGTKKIRRATTRGGA